MTSPIPPQIVAFLDAEPTPEQWRAISWPLEPYVLIAGAGSGKTSVMAARVIWLALRAIETDGAEGAWPGNVLCLTFTNKATEHLVAGIRRALSVMQLPEGEEPDVRNYHSFAQKILDEFGILEGLDSPRLLTPTQRVELCARVLDLMSFEHLHTQWQPAIIESILDLADQAQNHLVDPERIVQFNEHRLEELAGHRSDRAYVAAQERIELAKAAGIFRDLKRDLGVIDFGDQIGIAARILDRHPDVVSELRSRYSAVLLDEYQDTNVAQALLLERAFGGGHPVTAVGDPDQIIYAWRGTSLNNLSQFRERFHRSDGSPAPNLPLSTNFRSGSRILSAAEVLTAEIPPDQRPDEDKRLVPWPANGEGEVHVTRYRDEVVEAEAIAAACRRIHDEESHRWREMAVLCRTSRLFPSLQRALGAREIPVEIVGIAGLLRTPAVVEVLAYARAVANPLESVALARILLGPRYRVGYKDLARVAGWTKGKAFEFAKQFPDADEDITEDVPFLVAEAFEHLDEVEGLSEEGRARLEEFAAELVELRAEARAPVPDFLAAVIRKTGMLAELDAWPDTERARSSRRNLAAFLDEVHELSPLEGELTLQRFLDYIAIVEQRDDKQEWAPAQPSEADSVKVMTIHAAKGLEFDTVFVPGLASDILPNERIQQNPAERGKSLDFELRGDNQEFTDRAGRRRRLLPTYNGNLSEFKRALRKQEVVEERRTCYVAMTRARKRLFVSGAAWYGETTKPHDPGTFLDELLAWTGQERGLELEQENPLAGYREAWVRDFPGPARPLETDGLFPEGWRRGAVSAAGHGGVPEEALERLSPIERETYRELSEERRRLAVHLVEQEEARVNERGPLPSSVGVGSLIDYGRCPKLFYWSTIRPLPRFAGPAARIGTEIHRWIEVKSRGQATLLESEDERPDLTLEELAGAPGKIEELRTAFLASRFADKVPLYAERPFLLPVEGFTVSGRIDAIYGAEDGPWEIVDYKTGRRPSANDHLAGLQLGVYALACIDVWHRPADSLTLTYLYLASGEEESRHLGVDDVEEVRASIATWLRSISLGAYDPTPGRQCRWCDFAPFCDAGTAWLASEESNG